MERIQTQDFHSTPLLRNARHEKFAQLVASGIAANSAFTQVGHKGAQNSPRLSRNEFTAAEMLAKMCGWNELERVNVQTVEVKIDAGLIEQLRLRGASLQGARLALPGGPCRGRTTTSAVVPRVLPVGFGFSRATLKPIWDSF